MIAAAHCGSVRESILHCTAIVPAVILHRIVPAVILHGIVPGVRLAHSHPIQRALKQTHCCSDCSPISMSEDAVSLVDIKIASLEEAILKCEVQYQKVKRQCESSAAVAASAHGDKHPQVCQCFCWRGRHIAGVFSSRATVDSNV